MVFFVELIGLNLGPEIGGLQRKAVFLGEPSPFASGLCL